MSGVAEGAARQPWLAWKRLDSSSYGAAAEQGGNHGREVTQGYTKVRQEGAEDGRICDASQEALNVEEWPERPQGDQPEAGHRDRSLGGAEKGGEGSTAPRIEPLISSTVKDLHPVHKIQPCASRRPPRPLFSRR